MTRRKACISRGPFHRNNVGIRELEDLQARGASHHHPTTDIKHLRFLFVFFPCPLPLPLSSPLQPGNLNPRQANRRASARAASLSLLCPLLPGTNFDFPEWSRSCTPDTLLPGNLFINGACAVWSCELHLAQRTQPLSSLETGRQTGSLLLSPWCGLSSSPPPL